MAMIPLAEYARRLEKGEDSARRIARTGGFKTAVKIGNTWLIDEDEPWVDRRVKTGMCTIILTRDVGVKNTPPGKRNKRSWKIKRSSRGNDPPAF